MILDFWTTKLNPITMSPREASYLYTRDMKLKSNDIKYIHEDLSLNELYISSAEAQKIFGVGAKKLKNMLDRQYFKDIKCKSYCLRSHVEELERNFKSSINNDNEDIINYIHSNDLKKLLGVDTMQLFTMSKRHKWKKRKFKGHGNVKFFLKSEVLK